MNHLSKIAPALSGAFFFFCASTLAFGQSVLQAGPWTPGHAPMYLGGGYGQPVVQDSGTAAGATTSGVGLSELGITVRGTGTPPYANAGAGPLGTNLCDYDAPTTNATGYRFVCLSPNAQGGALIATGNGGSPATQQPLIFNINGTPYSMGNTNWLSGWFDSQFGATPGAMIYRTATNWAVLAPGNSGQVLQTLGGTSPYVQWAGTGGVGSVTSITAGTGLSGGTITTSGTIALNVPVAVALGGNGNTALTAHNVMLGEGTSPVSFSAPGVSGTVLTSNGTTSDPTFQSVAGTGTVTSISSGTGIIVSPSPIITSGTVSLAVATTSALGGIKGDNSTVAISGAGVLSCTTATTSQLGCEKPDGTTIGVTAGVLSVSNPVKTTAPTTCGGFSGGNCPTSGSGTYATPAGVKWIEIRMVGGGAGGGGGDGNPGGNGSNTVFGSLTSDGGAGGTLYDTGGLGGNASGGTTNITGGSGTDGAQSISSTAFGLGGTGGASALGGNGGGSLQGNGTSASAGSGAGGGGGYAGDSSSYVAGGGGGAGGNLYDLITSPNSTYSYTVGASGSGGAGGGSGIGGNGGNGGTGGILVIEHYNY